MIADNGFSTTIGATTMMKLEPDEQATLDKAAEIMERMAMYSAARKEQPLFSSPASVCEYLKIKLAFSEHEQFIAVFLDSKHRLIHSQVMFTGTIDGASVYPREVVKAGLLYNAAAVIFAHNHPSGSTDASTADIRITERLTTALALIDIRVLDHIIVAGNETASLKEKGHI